MSLTTLMTFSISKVDIKVIILLMYPILKLLIDDNNSP